MNEQAFYDFFTEADRNDPVRVLATVWIITQAGRVVPLADMPPGESAKWWAVEGSSHWQPGNPPGAASRQPATRRKVEATGTGAGLF